MLNQQQQPQHTKISHMFWLISVHKLKTVQRINSNGWQVQCEEDEGYLLASRCMYIKIITINKTSGWIFAWHLFGSWQIKKNQSNKLLKREQCLFNQFQFIFYAKIRNKKRKKPNRNVNLDHNLEIIAMLSSFLSSNLIIQTLISNNLDIFLDESISNMIRGKIFKRGKKNLSFSKWLQHKNIAAICF